jgi:hypothetical protein
MGVIFSLLYSSFEKGMRIVLKKYIGHITKCVRDTLLISWEQFALSQSLKIMGCVDLLWFVRVTLQQHTL